MDEASEVDDLPLAGFSYKDKEGNDAELTQSDQDYLVAETKRKFEWHDTEKAPLVRRWDAVEKAIRGITSTNKNDRFYALTPYAKQTLQTLVSHVWGRSLQTPNLFFDVLGQDEQSKEHAPTHKHQLLRHLEKDRARQKLDLALNLHGIPKGVAIWHVGYKTVTEEVYGPEDQINKWGETTPTADAGFGTTDRKVFEGGTVRVIHPDDFVFDTNNHENWDACWKCSRAWYSYEDIAADSAYSNLNDLAELCDNHREKKSRSKKSLGTNKKNNKTKDFTGIDDQGRIELLEVHGDIRLKDGTLLRNWTAVVAARKYVIRFEKNPYFTNPYVKWCYEQTEDGWGISPIEYIMGLIDASSDLFSNGVNAGKLALNPPMLAVAGMLPQKTTYLKQGMVLEYTPKTSMPNSMPQPIPIKYDVPFPFMQYCESQSEATTGATRQLSGNVTTNDSAQTATEFKGLQIVGNMIIDRVVDLFTLDAKLPIVRKVALINAMFNPEETTVPVDNADGIREYKEVTKDVYFGNYDYEIVDNKSEIERKQNINEKIALFMQGMQHPMINERSKALDLWKEIWRDLGYGAAGQYVMDDNEYIAFAAQQAAIGNLVQLESQVLLKKELMERGMLPDVQSPPPDGTDASLDPNQAMAGGAGMEPVPPTDIGAVA